MYHEDKVNDIEQTILYEMKDYTFDFKGDAFSLDVIQDDKQKQPFKIYHCKEGLCAYFQVPSSGPYLLKVMYDQEKYEQRYELFLTKLLKLAFVVIILLFLISIGFAIYALRPMREALYLLEEFLKDIIHDLNTPATSILLNAKLLRKKGEFEEIERIELCAKNIASLYKNLELMQPQKITADEVICLPTLLEQKIEIFKKLYPLIEFKKELSALEIKSNKNALERIVDNLLSNACKYNKKNGKVIVRVKQSRLVIEDTGRGIKDIHKIFQRYYKENDRGLGIGLSIVKQLCQILNITIHINSHIGKGTQVELCFTQNNG